MSDDPSHGGDDPTIVRPRYTHLPLPPYSYVPGHAPHPVSDPRGHMYGVQHEPVAPLRLDAWRESTPYLFAVDLFNHGYYWEAHEAWESLWHAAGRRGVVANWLKTLIKLAAAGVKAREGNRRGVRRHAARADELLQLVRAEMPAKTARGGGVVIRQLEESINDLRQQADDFTSPQPALVLPWWLELGDG